ncbi:MAG: hypothetical protein GOU98_00235 [Candidatus Altiarchaeota archaeon]|nr:hypothetical protein [Candidatus Altiarchaeota archaeon]
MSPDPPERPEEPEEIAPYRVMGEGEDFNTYIAEAIEAGVLDNTDVAAFYDVLPEVAPESRWTQRRRRAGELTQVGFQKTKSLASGGYNLTKGSLVFGGKIVFDGTKYTLNSAKNIVGDVSKKVGKASYDATIGKFETLTFDDKIMHDLVNDYRDDSLRYHEFEDLVSKMSIEERNKVTKVKKMTEYQDILSSLSDYSTKFSNDGWKFNMGEFTLDFWLEGVDNGTLVDSNSIQEVYDAVIRRKKTVKVNHRGRAKDIREKGYGDKRGWGARFFGGGYKDVKMTINEQLLYLLKEKNEEFRNEFREKARNYIDLSHLNFIENSILGKKKSGEIETEIRNVAKKIVAKTKGVLNTSYSENPDNITNKTDKKYDLNLDEIYKEVIEPITAKNLYGDDVEGAARVGLNLALNPLCYLPFVGQAYVGYKLAKAGYRKTKQKVMSDVSTQDLLKLKNTANILYNEFNHRAGLEAVAR